MNEDTHETVLADNAQASTRTYLRWVVIAAIILIIILLVVWIRIQTNDKPVLDEVPVNVEQAVVDTVVPGTVSPEKKTVLVQELETAVRDQAAEQSEADMTAEKEAAKVRLTESNIQTITETERQAMIEQLQAEVSTD